MKKKIFMITLAACLIVLSIAGSSLAYFTDTDVKTKVFTAGNVNITLTYDETTGKLFPGQTYNYPAIIENVGSEDAYVGAIIKVTHGTSNVNYDDISSVFVGLEGNTVKVVEADNGFTVYVIDETEITKDQTTTIFSKMAINAAWGNTEMAIFNDLSIEVTAYATQTVGFDDARGALTTAFESTDWANCPN